MSNSNELINKIDAFIRKYYKNQLIKGIIYTFGLVLSYFVVIAAVEYFGHFNTVVRASLFWSFLIFAGTILGWYIVRPLLHLWRIGKFLSYEQASLIIGNHFTEIKDRLLNTLQLQQLSDSKNEDELLAASIAQRTEQLRPIQFGNAINLRKNIRYMRFAIIPVIVIALVLLIAPGMIVDGSERLVKYNEYFEKKAPFEFSVLNKSLQTVQNADFEVKLKTNGLQLPDEVYILIAGKPYRMEKQTKTTFSYTFRNLQKDFDFNFLADDYTSKAYNLVVIPQPRVLNFEMHLHYPSYIGKKDESLQNTGDVNIPAGTEITWRFATSHVENLLMQFSDNTQLKSSRADELYTFSKKFLQTKQYSIKPANQYLQSKDSISYTINVSADAYPMVDADEQKDSINMKVSYFSGSIADDYGLSRLTFNYKFLKSDNQEKARKPMMTVPVKIDGSRTQQAFYYYFDFSAINIEPGDELEYFFEVWDNDGVMGSKSARSKPMVFKAPGKEELEIRKEDASKELKKDMMEALKESKNIQKDLKKMEEKLAEKKQLTYDDKKQVEELLKRQKALENRIDEIKKDHEQSIKEQQEFSEPNPEILEKQMELQKLMNQMFDEEMKDLMKQFEELLKQQDKDLLKDNLDKMQVQDKEVQKELDRMLEMYKKLEIEEKKQDVIDKLDQISKEQEKNSEDTKNKEGNLDEQKQKQDELNKKFDDIKKDIENIEKKNAELEQPDPMEDTEQEEQEIDKQQDESKQEMGKGNKKQAAQKQKNAADKMKEMKEKLEKDMQKKEEETAEEDYNNLRQILENLVKLSFDQEAVMEELKTVNGYNPQYVKIGQKQKVLKDDAKLIEDSLQSLSKRQIAIQPIINKEITQVNANMEKAIADLAERNTFTARTRQQYVMTHVNNLAVMLTEALKKMQEQMNAESKPGSGQCKKPGGKKPKDGKDGKSGKGEKGSGGKDLKTLRQMQEQLAKQIEDMKKGMKPGQNGQPGQGGMPSSKQLAQAAATQSAIRQKLRQLSQQYGKEGSTKLQKDLEEIQKLMDQNEKDLYNKFISPEMMKRQQDIQFRLLESEKARQEQETDNERKANSGLDQPNAAPKRFELYQKQKSSEKEILQTVPPNFNLYYKDKVKKYFDNSEKK